MFYNHVPYVSIGCDKFSELVFDDLGKTSFVVVAVVLFCLIFEIRSQLSQVVFQLNMKSWMTLNF